MLVDDADTASLKKWIVKRLEDISDADSDVLADYVLALVKSEDPDEQVKSNCLDNLEDFLRDHTASFVDDVLNAIRTKSYLPNAATSGPQADRPASPPFNPPSGPSNGNRRPSAQFQNEVHNGYTDQSHKRTWGDRAGSEQRDGQDSHYNRNSGGDRAIKQMRRGNYQGGAGRGGRQGDVSVAGLPGLGQSSMPSMQNMPPMPNPPPGFPPVDPNNPMASLLAMQQAMGFPPMPGMPHLPMGGPQNSFGQGAPVRGFPHAGSPPPRRIGERCRDYDTKGFCALGSVCPYEHGNDPIVVPADEYDPKNAAIDTERNTNGHGERRHHERGRGGRGRGRGEGGRRGGRAPFSSAGPNHDRSITAIVVENIPEDKFSEEAVREFFSEFGNIEEVTMQTYKRLAIVRYDEYWSARKAYDSPKVIFDNRFVKVYWYKPDHHSSDANGAHGRQRSESAGGKKDDEEMIDMEELAKKQAEAQKAHEEKQRMLKEAETQKAELAEKLKVQAEERKKLLEKLAEKQAKKGSPSPVEPSFTGGDGDAKPEETNGTDDKKSAQTEALRLKLAQLEAEAESMGINPNESYNASTYRGRGGRGAFRGRGGFAPRGRGGYDPSFRGGYRGRGGFGGPSFAGARGGAVKRLDNRPKRVVVKIDSEGEWTPERDEALRSHLFNNFEFDSVDNYPDGGKNAMIVAFKERYIAENFIAQSSDIPSIGKVQLSWAPSLPLPPVPSAAVAQAASSQPASSVSSATMGEDVAMGAGDAGGAGGGADAAMADTGRGGEEFDVADDDDRWMAA